MSRHSSFVLFSNILRFRTITGNLYFLRWTYENIRQRFPARPPRRVVVAGMLAAAGADGRRGLFDQLTPRVETKNIPLNGKRKERKKERKKKERDHRGRKDGKRGRRADADGRRGEEGGREE